MNESESKKDRRKRIRLTSDKTHYLQRYFEVKPRPSTSEKREISKCLNMSFRSVQVWFQNRRAKYKKDMQDIGSNLTNCYMEGSMDIIPGGYSTNNSLFMPRENFYRQINFYDNDVVNKPKKMYKFHDCTADKSILAKRNNDIYDENVRDSRWYQSNVQIYDYDNENEDNMPKNN